jgi:hypothetical protein
MRFSQTSGKGGAPRFLRCSLSASAVLNSTKVPRIESLAYERTRTEASEKVPKRTSICQYAVNAGSTARTRRAAPRLYRTAPSDVRPSFGAGRLVPASGVTQHFDPDIAALKVVALHGAHQTNAGSGFIDQD